MEDRHVIETELGLLRGHTKRSILSNEIYYVFQGIPYAKPPLGKLRFKAPQPFGKWDGIRDALVDGNDPKQPKFFRPGVDLKEVAEGSEDCLYLNVFMNELPENCSVKKPVLFSIHGGGFIGGSGSTEANGPDLLMNGDVVVVTMNYRCGAFGFLSLENEEVPGNAGLKDQTMALKWVQKNIVSFGGDPNNVTIFGISAGGASVNFHLLSRSSRGLFHKAIIQSGFSLSQWAIQPKPWAAAANLAKALGCKSDNTDEILEILQSASADDIVVATREISQNKTFLQSIGLVFTPCVEVRGTDNFLTDTPDSLMKKGEFNKVPVILGIASKEGSVLAFFNRINQAEFAMMNKNPELLVPSFLGLKPDSVEEKEATKAIWDFYLRGNPLSWDNVNDYLAYQSDFLFTTGMAEMRTGLVEKSSSSVYTYLFTNHSRCFCSNIQLLISENEDFLKLVTPETCHGADCMFLYVYKMIQLPEITAKDKEAIEKHVKAWTTFAKFGNPNCKELGVTWKNDAKSEPCFMEIGTKWTMREGIPFAERIDFWKKLSSKYCAA